MNLKFIFLYYQLIQKYKLYLIIFIAVCKNSSEVVIDFDDFDNQIQISIKDQGVGIKQEDLERVFERFYRVDKSRNRNNGGSGLGLAIVKHILEAHQQKIYVSSKVGKGSASSFYLQKD